MIKRAALTRYLTYFGGISTTALSIFLINYFLDPNEFAVWGVANSLIYVLSQLGQLTYVQYVEKYFPNLTDADKKNTLYKFVKTVFIFFPVWFFILVLMYFLGYFAKFNITNIVYLFLMINISVVIEASIEIVSKYLVTKKESIGLDKNEFLYSKFLRLFIFTLLLINGFSIYHLLFTNIILRCFLFVRIINLENNSLSNLFGQILRAQIWNNNFTKIKYTFVAFGIKTLLIAFLNVTFLFYSTFASSKEIAVASLGVLIVNNLRPAIGSLTSLLSPMISQNVEQSKQDSKLISNVLYLNSFSASVFLFTSCILVIFYNTFFDITRLVGYSPDSVILYSILASTISSLYFPKLWHVKFSNLENKLFLNLVIIFFTTFLSFAFLPIVTNVLIFYIIFEILVYIASYRLYKIEFPNFKNKLAPSFYAAIFMIYLTLSGVGFEILQIIVFLIFVFYDLKKVKSLLNSDTLD